eukprot:Skav218421  [mRNA]  locus=scaffold420:12377:13111:- [translate_table: standard]
MLGTCVQFPLVQACLSKTCHTPSSFLADVAQEAPKVAAEEAKAALQQLHEQEEMKQKALAETFQAHAAPGVQPSFAGASQAAEPYNQAIKEAQRMQSFYEAWYPRIKAPDWQLG